MRQEGGGKSGWDGGKVEWKLSKVNISAVSRGQTKFIGEFKMVVGNVISIRE